MVISHTQLIAAMAFLGVSASLYMLLAWYAGRRRAVLQRFDELCPQAADATDRAETPRGVKRLLGATVLWIASPLLPGDDAKRTRLQQRMLHAGLYSRSAIHLFVIARLLLMVLPFPLAVAVGFFGLVELKPALVCAAVATCAGMLLPSFWLGRRKAHRQVVFARSLPDFLDLLVTCLESGLSLDAALRRVTSELRCAHPLLAVEMECVQTEIDLGASADTALHNLAERTDLEAVQTLASFIQQARRYGTSISDALRTHGEMLREEREQRAEEKAQKAAVKILFPTLLFIFPTIFIVLAGPAAIQLNENLANQNDQEIETTSP